MGVYYYLCCNEHKVRTDVIAKLSYSGMDVDSFGLVSLEKLLEDHKDCNLKIMSEKANGFEDYRRLE